MKSRNKRDYKTGGLRERTPNSWELKVHAFDPKTGTRKARFYTHKGTKIDAKKKLRDLMFAAEAGDLPDEKRLVESIVGAWDGGLNVSPKTAERYRELSELYIRPHLGALKVRSILPSRISTFYTDLHTGKGPDGQAVAPLAPRTISHIHRLVVQIFDLAERDKLIDSNPAKHARRPKVEETEMEILNEVGVRDVLTKLRGRNSPAGRAFYVLVLLALATGMRRGEILALRWKDVDIEAGTLQVNQSLEQTKKGLRFKSPKTKHGRRPLTVPATVITELRAHRTSQNLDRLKLGLGKDGDDALVFRQIDGDPLKPSSVTAEWRRLVGSLRLPTVSFHALRHTHASQLISAALDVLTISRRMGHSTPSITLNIYGHLFKPTDREASAVIERALSNALA